MRHCCLAVEAGLTAVAPRSPVLKDRDPAEDDDVWLVPCFFVRVGARRMGFTRALLTAAVEVAGEHCAKAVERFPLAAGPKVSADGFLGAEQVFAGCGFTDVARPVVRRVVMAAGPEALTEKAVAVHLAHGA